MAPCPATHRNTYGDDLDVLQRHVSNESVDLVSLDPPLKSNQDDNVPFEETEYRKVPRQVTESAKHTMAPRVY
jgi:hypothetical protein